MTTNGPPNGCADAFACEADAFACEADAFACEADAFACEADAFACERCLRVQSGCLACEKVGVPRPRTSLSALDLAAVRRRFTRPVPII